MNQEAIKDFIEELLRKAHIEFDSVAIEESEEQTVFQIQTQDSAKLIGSRGDTVRALNHIVKKAFENKEEHLRFLIDVNGYRTKKIEDLKETAKLLAERARSLKYNVEMTPMSGYERMIVHTALADEPNIKTESHGEGRDRRVVISYVQD
ncbi:KH domain-containing protein [Candidatus Kaiserbacteria bacterium]|nr:MAG: KH domain-containing protein [Candidatus Kaiserbacteria bacterium]